MGYLVENLVYFMAEAVDRNGKKDPSLGMKCTWDISRKASDKYMDALYDYGKAVDREAKVNKNVDRKSGLDAINKAEKHAHLVQDPSRDNFKVGDRKSQMRYYNDSRKHLNAELTRASTATKLMHKDAKAKKAHNESALFNDPIWDEL